MKNEGHKQLTIFIQKNDNILTSNVEITGEYKTFNIGIEPQKHLRVFIPKFLKQIYEFPIYFSFIISKNEISDITKELTNKNISFYVYFSEDTINEVHLSVKIRDELSFKVGWSVISFYVENGMSSYIYFNPIITKYSEDILINMENNSTFLYLFDGGFTIYSNEERFSSISKIISAVPEGIIIEEIES